MNKKIILSLISLLICVTPIWAQKLSKEEKAAKAKMEYDNAIKAVEERAFAIVASSYTDSDGIIESNTDNTNFFSCEGEDFFMQGKIVCDNDKTNIAKAIEYTPTYNKKGNLRLSIIVSGRMIQGTYVISVRANTNMADVIFTPQSGTVRKFSGALLPLKEADYYKRSSPI